MNDTARMNAIARRDAAFSEIIQCEERIRLLRADIARAEEFLRLWSEFSTGSGRAVDNVENSNSPNVSESGDPPRLRLRNPKKEDVAEAARELIRERGAPIQRDELFHRLAERGCKIQGANPEMVLSTMLWRMQERVVRLPKFGYWLREEGYAPAAYDPNVPFAGDDEHQNMARLDIRDALPNVDGDAPPEDHRTDRNAEWEEMMRGYKGQ